MGMADRRIHSRNEVWIIGSSSFGQLMELVMLCRVDPLVFLEILRPLKGFATNCAWMRFERCVHCGSAWCVPGLAIEHGYKGKVERCYSPLK
jgi:hypothetical protein